MKQKTQNSTITFEPEVISEGFTVTFTKLVNANGTTITGTLKKDGQDVGTIAHDTASGIGGYHIVNIKPVAKLKLAEIASLYTVLPSMLAEMLEEENPEEATEA